MASLCNNFGRGVGNAPKSVDITLHHVLKTIRDGTVLELKIVSENH